MQINQIILLLKAGKIGVMPTDTVYGIVGSALNPQTVEKIYQLRKRSKDKPMIILISALVDLEKFDVKLNNEQKNFLKKIWPNPISVVLPTSSKKFKYLHRGKKSLAFRIPKKEILLKILQKVGPLVAPSANYQGEQPSKTIKEAKKYFAQSIDFYVDEGTINFQPSTIIKLDQELAPTVLRNGSIGLSQLRIR